MHVLDLETGLLGRKLPAGETWGIPVFGPGEPRVLFTGKGMPVKLYSARGTLESTRPILEESVLFGAVSPDGEGFLLMAPSTDPAVRELLGHPGPDPGAAERGRPPGEGAVLVRAERSAKTGELRLTSGLEFPRALRAGANLVLSSLEQGLGFALVRYNDYVCELLAVEAVGGELR